MINKTDMKKAYYSLFLSLLVLLPLNLKAQDHYRISSDKSTIVIRGTSSLHDWEMDASDISGDVKIALEKGTISEITEGTVLLKSSEIKSHNSIMDNKAQDALRSEKYPEITFRITRVDIHSSAGSQVHGQVTGRLSLAGVSKEISTGFKGEVLSSGHVKISGQFALDMLAYKIDPPTAMMGTLKTGNQVELDFALDLKQDMRMTTNNH